MSRFTLILYCGFIRLTVTTETLPAKVTINAGGAQLVASVFQVWEPVYQAYRSVYANINLSYEGINGVYGIRGLEKGDYQYVVTLEPVITEEMYASQTDLQLFPAFALPLSVVYNVPELSQMADSFASGSGLNLTAENLLGIFNGTIRNWNDDELVVNNSNLSQVNRSIIVVVRKDTAGITTIFTNALSSFADDLGSKFESFSDGCSASGVPKKWNSSLNIRCIPMSWGVNSYLVTTKYTIGFIVSSDARDNHLPEARLLNREGNWVRPSVQTTQAAMDNVSSDLGPRLTGSLVNAPGAVSYPIAGYVYVLIRKVSRNNCSTATEMYRMFKYLLENDLARTILIRQGQAPLSGVVLRQVKQLALDQMQCGGVMVRDLAILAAALEDGSFDAWKLPVTVVCALFGVALVMVLLFYLYIKYTQNRSALRSTFVISLNIIETVTKSAGSLQTLTSSKHSKTNTHDTMEWAAGVGLGVVKTAAGEQFLTRRMCKHLQPDGMQWSAKVALVRLKEKLAHNNVMRLIGVTLINDKWNFVNSCPTKGRLQDVLHAGKYHLDEVFRYSILSDIAEGMIFLHRNGVVHGQLTSNSCYIDSRWNVVVGDWEQFVLHRAQKVPFVAFEDLYDEANAEPEREIGNYAEYFKNLYWSAPEAIVADANYIFVVSNPEKSADVYSYGVILFEIFTNLMPYEGEIEREVISRPHHVIAAVKQDNIRPRIPQDLQLNLPNITRIIFSTWLRDVSQRPSFSEIQKLMRIANPKRRNIVDSMMQAIESYALSLEEKVAERTKELEKLTANMESLLHSMLPPLIADKLAKGIIVEPEYFESSTVYFSDIVGFTSLAAASSPIDIVNLLNDLYSAFDSVIQKFDVYKVETIGDSYMCISGLPNRNGVDHANQIASMSLDMLFTVTTIPVRHMSDRNLQIRIGAHSGAVVAGVVGLTMPRYCLFGDTVNTASRMESSSLPMRIQISEATRFLLEKLRTFSIISRGELLIKGKGMMKTYWLVGKENYSNPLPVYDSREDDRLAELLDESQIK